MKTLVYLKELGIISLCVSTQKSLNSPFGESDWKVHKKIQAYLSGSRGLHRAATLFLSILGAFGRYLFWGGKCSLSTLCYNSWHSVWDGYIGAELLIWASIEIVVNKALGIICS